MTEENAKLRIAAARDIAQRLAANAATTGAARAANDAALTRAAAKIFCDFGWDALGKYAEAMGITGADE